MVLSISIVLLILLTYLSIKKNRNAIGIYIFIFLFLPQEIVIANFFNLTAHKFAYIIFSIYVFLINGFNKKNPMLWGYFVLVLSLIVPFYNNTHIKGNANYTLFVYFIPDLILPSLLIFYGIKSPKDIYTIIMWMIGLIFIWGMYGIFETFSISNPFIEGLINEFPEKTQTVVTGYNYVDNSIRFGSSQRLQCTVWHPIAFGIRINLILSFLIFLKINYTNIFLKKSLVNYFYYTSIIIIVLMSFFTRSRSVWIGTLIILGIYGDILFNKRQIKRLIISLFTIVIGFNINQIIVFINEILFKNVEGSSFEMRFNQFAIVFDMIKNNFFFGLGLEFISYFIENNTLDTDIYGFESIIFTTIIETGCIGLFSLIYFLSLTRKSLINNTNNYKKSINILFIPFIITIILTGEMQNLYIFLILMPALYTINLSNSKIKFINQ